MEYKKYNSVQFRSVMYDCAVFFMFSSLLVVLFNIKYVAHQPPESYIAYTVI